MSRRALDGRAALVGLGAATVALSVALSEELSGARAGQLERPARLLTILGSAAAVYGLACAWALRRRRPTRLAFGIVLVVAVAARLVLALQAPVVSNDAYRYVWDGRVQAHGVNPYRYPPADPALAGLRDASIYEQVDRKQARTIYPPAAEAAFSGLYRLHGDSVVWTKLALALVDVVTILLLALLLVRLGERPERSLLYAWHPLVLLEVAHSGHVDALAIPLLLVALHASLSRRFGGTALALAGAALVKPYALLALPALLARSRPRQAALALAVLAAAVAAAYAPFLRAGGNVLGYLPGYLHEEGFTSGRRFYLLDGLERLTGAGWLEHGLSPAGWYVALAAVALGALAVLCWRRPLRSVQDLASRTLLLFTAGLVLTTPAYPWYSLIPLALLPLARGLVLLPATVVTGTAGLLYLNLKLPSHPAWPLHVAYGGGALALALAGLVAARRGARAKSATPAANGTSAVKPSTSFALDAEAKTWRTSPSR